MIKRSFMPLASLGALLLVSACSTDGAFAPAPIPGGPSLELAEGDEGPIPHDTLWASDVVYRGDAADAGPSMSIQAGASTGPLVRVAVLDSGNSVPLGSRTSRVYLGGTGDWVMTDRSNGTLLVAGSGNNVQVTLAAVPETHYRLQVTCGSRTAVDALKAAAEALGHPTLTETIPACTRLLIGKFASNASFTIRNNYKNVLISQGLAPSTAFWRLITLPASYRVLNGLQDIVSLNPVQVTATDGFVTIGTGPTSYASYRGVAFARVSGPGKMAGINELPMEQYLYGVVPRELGPLQYPEIEAQKAQTISARTYALRNMGKRSSDGYDLRATTSDQVYGGYGSEQPVSSAAIDATRGIVARHGGALIDALYSSASGGHTADSEEAFGSIYPYARGIPDAERGEAFAHVPSLNVFKAHANPTSLRATKEGDFETDWPSRHRWTFEWSASEIRSALSSWKGFDVGEVRSITVTGRGPSGRALGIVYETSIGTYTATKDGIRTSLRYIDANGRFQSMWSTLFFIEPVVKGNVATGGFRIFGGGFGHGVGLSQVGAVGMASKGHDYQQILKHYFRDITLEPAY